MTARDANQALAETAGKGVRNGELWRAEIMVKGRFSDRFSPVVLKVYADNEKSARAKVRKQAKRIGTPGSFIDLRTDADGAAS